MPSMSMHCDGVENYRFINENVQLEMDFDFDFDFLGVGVLN